MPFSKDDILEVQPQLTLLSSLQRGGRAYAIIALTRSLTWVRGWLHYLFPTGNEPDISKSYKTRAHLPVKCVLPPYRSTYLLETMKSRLTITSIFIPVTYSAKSSTENLPTLFTIHGGGFTVGNPDDDNKWNRMFADTHEVLVIALNYSKAPFYPFPTGIHDLEALIMAFLADDSLPIDRSQCSIAGFSAGGNLALAVTQMKDVKTAFKQHGSTGFKAVIPLYPGLDRTVTRDYKATLRQYKAGLSPNRNSTTDSLHGSGKAFDWSYIPVGQDLRDPLVSPIYAPRETLPPHIFLIACELDLSSHDAWRMACRLAGREEPSMDEKPGREECGETGKLELLDEKFAWEALERGVRWLLVPDVVHGFDHLPPLLLGDETSVRDAEMKNIKVIEEVGHWLKTRVYVQ
ncbi:Arylesterase [Hyphodiscus hymeniophilus]|uniref:Arylesterase n=1 Tax=Hyphodiscus hymeniophilus TaxID=353542 RepID=A0A9P7AW50_9HELO|nr:Arylesterase [Hyphodiscus hymeniophilus]